MIFSPFFCNTIAEDSKCQLNVNNFNACVSELETNPHVGKRYDEVDVKQLKKDYFINTGLPETLATANKKKSPKRRKSVKNKKQRINYDCDEDLKTPTTKKRRMKQANTGKGVAFGDGDGAVYKI